MDSLRFDPSRYETRTVTLEGRSVTFCAYLSVPYVRQPVCPEWQTLNLFVPAAYYDEDNAVINGFTIDTAPIYFPNTIGAYMSGRADEPGPSFRNYAKGKTNASFFALERGFIVVSPATRGRDSRDAYGNLAGTAPAAVVDLKAAVRYLRYNRDVIPGDVEKIISDGTSAGGALSALLGATGNAAAYEPYLEEIGAARERDDIFAAMCYCPIMNLEHADMAYEWLLKEEKRFHSMRFLRVDGVVKMQPFEGDLNAEQLEAGEELRNEFVQYVNSLSLSDDEGQPLRLNADGSGSLRDLLQAALCRCAQAAADRGTDLSAIPYVTLDGGQVTSFDLDAHVRACGRMKPCPSFDEWDGSSPENEEFGGGNERSRHFGANSARHDKAGLSMADPEMIRMMNPMEWLKDESCQAKHWRVRHGSADCHTSWAIPLLFAQSLKKAGLPVDFAYAWGEPHSGNYDMDDLFAWMEAICRA